MLRGLISFQKVEPTSKLQDKLGSFGDMKTWTRGKNPELYQFWTSCSCSKPPSWHLSKVMFVFDFFLMVIMVNHHLSPPPFGINIFYFIPSILLCKSKHQKKPWINLRFRFESQRVSDCLICFLHSLSIKKNKSTTFSSRDTDFWCQGYNVGCNKLGNWPFPTYDTHFEGGIWPLGLLGPGMRCTPSCKGPPAHLRIIYMCRMSIWKKDVFWKKKGRSAQNISPLSTMARHFGPRITDVSLWWALGLELEIWRL